MSHRSDQLSSTRLLPRPAVAAVLVLGVAAFMAPMFFVPDGIASGDAFRDNDWLNCRSHDVMSRLALLEYGQFPLRCHLIGGGFPLVAHPSDGSWAPTIVMVLLFGDVIGVKINLLLMVLIGTFGVYGLARRWLELPVGPSVFAALLFGFSAWAPSQLLVGFYNQVFFVLVPAILFLLVTSRGRPARLLWAGLLLCLVLQQGGNVFPTVCHFLGVMCWLMAAGEVVRAGRGWRGWVEPLGLLLLLSASLSFARGAHNALVVLVALVPAGMWLYLSGPLRGFARALGPWGGRLALVIAVALVLGAGRIAGLAYVASEASYDRGLDELRYWFPRSAEDLYWVERFYETPRALLSGLMERVPSRGSYVELGPWESENTDYEYAFLGLTAGPLLLALLAVFTGAPRRKVILLSVALAVYTAICVGWAVPPDFHFLLVYGLPWLGDFGQPLKYYNFYMLLPLVLLAGLGVARLTGGVRAGSARIAVHAALLALLAVPFAQNTSILGDLFAVPRAGAEPAGAYHQVAMVGDASWVDWGDEAIREASYMMTLREFRRPDNATEYHNAPRGVGVVDWYGTVVMPEYTIPSVYLTRDGAAHPNPRYRGEAWLDEGRGVVRSVEVRPNTIDLDLDLETPATVVINQNWLPGFVTSAGELGDLDGLLAVELAEAGEHQLRLSYRPPWLLLGLTVSGLGFVAWVIAQILLAVRGRRSRIAG